MARNKKDHHHPWRIATTFLSRGTLRRSMYIAVLSAAIVFFVLFVAPSYNEYTKLATTTLKQPQQQTSRTTTDDSEQQSKLVSVQKAEPKHNNNDEDEATTDTAMETKTTAVSTPAAAVAAEGEAETTPWQRLIDNAQRRFFKIHEQSQGDFTSPEARAACARFVPSWILQLRPALEEKVFSQYGEDGITRFILQNVAPSSLALSAAAAQEQGNIDNDKFYVEFGVENGMECNTRLLRELYNWTGLLMDGGYVNASIGLQREMIHPDNVVALFEKYKVPKSFGLLSEDTDYLDYYLWHSILQAGYRPRVLISEFNSNFNGGSSSGNSEQTTTAEDLELASVTVHAPLPGQVRRWDGTDYYGVSALALKRLWNKYGYIMIYCTKRQVNCFGIHESDALLPALLLLEKSSNKNNTSLSATATMAQECLWNKPLTWPLKTHPCNKKFESWSHVDKDGNLVADSKVFPLVVQHCRTHLHRKDNVLFVS